MDIPIERVSMSDHSSLTVVAVFGVVLALGVGAVFATSAVGGVGGFFGEDSEPPKLLSFDTATVQCIDDPISNSSTSIVAGDANTKITYARNVSLPGAAYGVGNATFERVNESTYELAVPIEEQDTGTRDCPGVVRYNATVQIPAGEDPWNIIIKHNNSTATTIYGNSSSSPFGGSASAGGSVSADPPRNQTTASP